MIENLPKYYKKDTGTWVDLDLAFIATTDGWEELATNFRNGYIFHLADTTQLKYLEEMLKVPVDETLSNEYRAEVVINIAKQFYPLENPTLSETEADYTLTIFFGNMQVLPVDIDIFRNTVIDILQADLDFIVELDVALSAFTHDELNAYTHDNLVAYRQST